MRKLSKSLGSSETPILVNDEKAPEKVKTYPHLLGKIDMILAIGPYLYHDPKVLYKLLRIMAHYLNKVLSRIATQFGLTLNAY